MQAVITDCFDIRPNLKGIDHVPGFVMFLKGDELPGIGTTVEIPVQDGTTAALPVLEVKLFGEAYSVFVGQQFHQQVPVGTVVSWTPHPAGVAV